MAAMARSLSAFSRTIFSSLLVESSAILRLNSASLSALYAETSLSASSFACLSRSDLAAEREKHKNVGGTREGKVKRNKFDLKYCFWVDF